MTHLERATTRRLLVWATAMVGVLAMGCGDETPSSTPAPPDAGQTDSGPEPTGPLRLGVLLPQSGPNAALGPAVANGILLATEQINAAGGVLGAPIALIQRDTRSLPNGGLEAALGLSQDPGIRAFLGALSSAVTEQVVSVAAEIGMPTISPASTAPSLTTIADAGTFFRTVPSDALQGRLLARYALATGHENAAIMLIDNAYGQNLAKEFTTHFVAGGGVVSVTVPHAEDVVEADYARDIEKILAASGPPDLILLLTYEAQGVQIMQDQEFFQLTQTWLFADGLRTEALAKEAGADKVAGIRGTSPTSPSSPTFETFRLDYKARFGVEPGAFTGPAYDAVYLIALAAIRAGSLERSAILSQLGSITVALPGTSKVGPGDIPLAVPAGALDYDGVSGPIEWDPQGDPQSATYEIYEFQPKGTILQVCQLGPDDPIEPCLSE